MNYVEKAELIELLWRFIAVCGVGLAVVKFIRVVTGK
jgi:hypothetical protein